MLSFFDGENKPLVWGIIIILPVFMYRWLINTFITKENGYNRKESFDIFTTRKEFDHHLEENKSIKKNVEVIKSDLSVWKAEDRLWKKTNDLLMGEIKDEFRQINKYYLETKNIISKV